MPCESGETLQGWVFPATCSLGCPGCFNPQTHTLEGGEFVDVGVLYDRIAGLGDAIEGVTISGGEPLEQPRPLRLFLERVRGETSLSVLLLTGYRWNEVQRMPDRRAVLAYVDVLIAGRYDGSRRLARGLCGSTNKTVHVLTDRYALDSLRSAPPAPRLSSRQTGAL